MNKTVFLLALLANGFLKATPTITNVMAQQRYPWNGKVDISYSVEGVEAHCKNNELIASLKVTATDKVANKTYTVSSLSGDTALTDGTHHFVWDLDGQGLSIKSTNVVFSVSCETSEALYCVIDLSSGADATNYPVTYLAAEPVNGFNVDEYKTTKLVLRRLNAGTFIMGDDRANEAHRVTLTKSFYMGLFEVTQKQWALVMGANPSKDYGVGDTYPVYFVSYNMIRGSSAGAGWPASSAVDASSFLGKLQARTGLNLDLPTGAQWEYACRAGTTTHFYWGDFEIETIQDYAWYWDNADDNAHPVGGKIENGWGLYDMIGNVCEWCLDWAGWPHCFGTDPVGPSSGTSRVGCGGSWASSETSIGPSDWYDIPQESQGRDNGFRLSKTLP